MPLVLPPPDEFGNYWFGKGVTRSGICPSKTGSDGRYKGCDTTPNGTYLVMVEEDFVMNGDDFLRFNDVTSALEYLSDQLEIIARGRLAMTKRGRR